MRCINLLTPHPRPRFRLPSASDIGALLSSFPPGRLGGATVDLTNFFWSLCLPPEAVGMFRVGGLACPARRLAGT